MGLIPAYNGDAMNNTRETRTIQLSIPELRMLKELIDETVGKASMDISGHALKILLEPITECIEDALTTPVQQSPVQQSPVQQPSNASVTKQRPSRKAHQGRLPNPEVAVIVAMLADDAPTLAIKHDLSISPQKIGNVKMLYSKQINELGHLPVGEKRMEYLQRVFGWAGGATYDASIQARAR